MKNRFLLVIPLIIVFNSLLSNKGYCQTDTEFWFVVPEVTVNHGYPGGIPAYLNLSASAIPATVTISQPASPSFTPIVIYLAANSSRSIDLSSYISLNVAGTWTEQNLLENKTLNASGVNNFGLYIQSTSKITAYYEVNNTLNGEIWMLKGKNALGTDFYTPFQTHGANGNYGSPDATAQPYSAIDIVATENNTTVVVIPTKNAGYGNTAAFITANTARTFTLNKGQTLSIFPQNKSQLAANRLAGTHVTSNRPIAITLKDDSAIHPTGGCRDIIGDQMIPVNVTGVEYIVMRTFLTSYDFVYVVATQNATPVYVDGVLTTTLNSGQQYQIQFPTTYPTGYMKIASRLVSTDPYKPIYVMHVGGFGCEQGSAIIPPIDVCTGSTQVDVYRTRTSPFYLTLMVKDGAQDGFLVDGVVRDDLIPPAAFTLVPGSSWRVARFGSFTTAQLALGYHKISNRTDVFHLGVINGDAATSCKYSYFSNFNKNEINAFVVESGGPGNTLCNGDSAQLFASGGTSFVWTPSDFLNDPFSNSPIAKNVTNSIKYKVVATGACNLKDSAEVDLIVAPYLEANFTTDVVTGKAPLTVRITNNSINAAQCFWDLNGDGDLNDPGEGFNNNPTFEHTFENNTNNDVLNKIVLLVYDAMGICSKSSVRSVIVYPKLKADFSIDKISGCSPSAFNFTNTTTSNAKSFQWDIENDGTIDYTTRDIPSQVFSNSSTTLEVRTIPIKLSATDSTGYTISEVKTITIYPQPTTGFTIDNNSNPLGCSPLTLNITSTSTNSDTFKWSVDGDSVSNDPNLVETFENNAATSIVKIISFTSSNHYGCSATQTSNAIVQSLVKAEMAVDNATGCSPLIASFTNLSSFGSTNFLWDINNDETIDFMSKDIDPQTFFNTSTQNESRSIPIKLTASNNAGCTNSAISTITINPLPLVNIGKDRKICDGNHITLDAQNDGMKYLWSNGQTIKMIDVQVTGTYWVSVTNSYGCSQKDSMNLEVNPIPTVDLGGNKSICFGDSVILDAGNSESTHLWNSGQTNQVITVFVPGTYLVVVTNPENCTNTDQVEVKVFPKPTVDIGPDSIRTSLPYSLNSNINDVNYLWSTGEVTPSIVVNSYGSYSLTVTDQQGCNGFDKIEILTATNIKNNDRLKAKITLFPNPTSAELNISIESENAESYRIEVINSLSMVVKSIKTEKTLLFNTQIDIHDLVPDIYLVRVSNNKGTSSFKIVVQK